QDYDAYVAAVRAEYAAVPDEEFAAARLAVLEPLTEGELFRTSKGRALTAAAQANLRRECADLRAIVGID
ncbi:MAG TPA: metal-dependent phosphohydrolase, partial [Geodermatophilus sp.]|nr:metal-dependent phosphohydrolase [Geodermatophilus sp.]